MDRLQCPASLEMIHDKETAASVDCSCPLLLLFSLRKVIGILELNELGMGGMTSATSNLHSSLQRLSPAGFSQTLKHVS